MDELKLDRSGGKLLSSQLVQQLKAAIRRGDYGPGAVLPGAVELAAAANVGEKTARRALPSYARTGRRFRDDDRRLQGETPFATVGGGPKGALGSCS